MTNVGLLVKANVGVLVAIGGKRLERIKKQSLSIDAETHKRVAFRKVETGREMWELIREAWGHYETATGAIPASSSTDHPPKEVAKRGIADPKVQVLHELVDRLLGGGDAGIAVAVEANLRAFVKLAESRDGAGSARSLEKLAKDTRDFKNDPSRSGAHGAGVADGKRRDSKASA